MRDFINIIDGEILMEAQDYMSMFTILLNIMKSSPDPTTTDYANSTYNDIQQDIAKAKQNLLRKDRIIWWLRYRRTYIANTILMSGENNTQLFDYCEKIVKAFPSESSPTIIMADLSHYLSLGIPEIDNYVFKNQLWEDVKILFVNWEDKWKKERIGVIPYQEEETVIKFPDGFQWVLLPRGHCSEEANAMGHCGNSGDDSGARILSLRRIVTKGNKRFWKPSLTFILDRDGVLGEMKGRGNDKPVERYHAKITELLLNPLIKGIKGGGYLPENNFEIGDLSPDEKKRITEMKPRLLSMSDRYVIQGPNNKEFRQDLISRMISIPNSSLNKEALLKNIQWSNNGNRVIFAKYSNLEDFLKFNKTRGGLTSKQILDYINNPTIPTSQEIYETRNTTLAIMPSYYFNDLEEYLKIKEKGQRVSERIALVCDALDDTEHLNKKLNELVSEEITRANKFAMINVVVRAMSAKNSTGIRFANSNAESFINNLPILVYMRTQEIARYLDSDKNHFMHNFDNSAPGQITTIFCENSKSEKRFNYFSVIEKFTNTYPEIFRQF
jgi:hypothetical protein